MSNIKSLVDFFKLSTNDEDGYCSVRGDKDYTDWENKIAKPAMEAQGFMDIRFYTTDGDSFGPLVRGISAKDKNGHRHQFYYG